MSIIITLFTVYSSLSHSAMGENGMKITSEDCLLKRLTFALFIVFSHILFSKSETMTVVTILQSTTLIDTLLLCWVSVTNHVICIHKKLQTYGWILK